MDTLPANLNQDVPAIDPETYIAHGRVKALLEEGDYYIDETTGLPSFQPDKIKGLPFESIGCEWNFIFCPKADELDQCISPWCPDAECKWLDSYRIIFKPTQVFDVQNGFLHGDFIAAFKFVGERTSLIFKIEDNQANLISFGSATAILQYQHNGETFKSYQTRLNKLDRSLYLPGIVYKAREVRPDNLYRFHRRSEWERFVNILSSEVMKYHSAITHPEA